MGVALIGPPSLCTVFFITRTRWTFFFFFVGLLIKVFYWDGYVQAHHKHSISTTSHMSVKARPRHTHTGTHDTHIQYSMWSTNAIEWLIWIFWLYKDMRCLVFVSIGRGKVKRKSENEQNKIQIELLLLPSPSPSSLLLLLLLVLPWMLFKLSLASFSGNLIINQRAKPDRTTPKKRKTLTHQILTLSREVVPPPSIRAGFVLLCSN